MRSLILILISSFLLAAAAPTAPTPVWAKPNEATQLVMMEEDGCPWCERWMQEIGDFYHMSAEGRIAPLRKVDVHDALPQDLNFLKPAYFTPTFILVSGGREIGRIQGYPGEDFFWPMLAELVAKIKPSRPVKAEAAQ